MSDSITTSPPADGSHQPSAQSGTVVPCSLKTTSAVTVKTPGDADAGATSLHSYRHWFWAAVVYVCIRCVDILYLARISQLRGSSLSTSLTVWDGKWMLALARYGYNDVPASFTDANGLHTSDTAYAFFPGYPMLVRGLSHIPGFSEFGAAISTNVVFGLAAGLAAYRLGVVCARRMDPDLNSHRVGLIVTALFAATPMGIVLNMAYTEAMYCALAGWALICIVERRWVCAGALTFFAGLCRPTAIVLIFVLWLAVLVFVVGQKRRGYPLFRHHHWRVFFALTASPVGWLGYLAVVARHTGRLNGWFEVQTQGWGTGIDWGASTFRFIDHSLTDAREVAAIATCWILLAALCLIVVAWVNRLPWQISMYGTLVVVSLIASGGLMISRPRLLLPAFVLLIPVAIGLSKRKGTTAFFALAALVTITTWFGVHMVAVYPHAM